MVVVDVVRAMEDAAGQIDVDKDGCVGGRWEELGSLEERRVSARSHIGNYLLKELRGFILILYVHLFLIVI